MHYEFNFICFELYKCNDSICFLYAFLLLLSIVFVRFIHFLITVFDCVNISYFVYSFCRQWAFELLPVFNVKFLDF